MTRASTRRRGLGGWLVTVALVVALAIAGDIRSAPTVSAAADANLVPIVPTRLLETRSGPNEKTVDGKHQGVGKIEAGDTYELQVAGRGGVDAGADAVMLNVTAVAPDTLGFLTVFPCTPEVPQASHVNYFAGDIAPNSVLAKVSDTGTICIFSLARTDVIVDATGYVPTGGAPVPVEPARLVETRRTPTDTTVDGLFEGIGRAKAGDVIEFDVTGRGGVPANASAAYLNVTAIFPDAPGFLTVFPCGNPIPETSNVNYGAGDVTPNAVLSTIGTGGRVCIFTLANADIIADVNAYLPPGGNRVSVQPARCADTRPDGKTFDGKFEGDGKIDAGGFYAITIAGRCNVAADASAAYTNVTAVNPEAAGFLTVWPCDEARPGTSNVNYGPGEVQPNAVLSKISFDGNGQICVYSLARTDVIVDVSGYVPAPGLFGIAEIGIGQNQGCSRMEDGPVWCWGNGGHLGDGENIRRYTPEPVPGITDAVDLEVASGHTCAVLINGTAKCWGDNGDGQLGDGTDTTPDYFDRRLSPVAVKNLTGITDISAWDNHTCAITDDDDDATGDTVWCWGSNGRGQLGDGTTDDRLLPGEVLGLPASAQPVEVGAGSNHSCALLDDGSIYCWGWKSHRLGAGPTHPEPTGVPAKVVGISTATDIAVGRNHTCAVLADTSVMCWGLGGDGELGNGTTDSSYVPVAVTELTSAAGVTAGQSTSCALLTDGTAKCWGDDGQGQLGDGGADANEFSPVAMITGSDDKIVQLETSGLSSCATLADSSAVCWGYNFGGILGVDTANRATATPVVVGSGR